MIRGQDPIPLYFRVKNNIKSKIMSKELNEQDCLPSESELCKQYGVSRATIRQALSELMNEGFIYRIQGKGTYITDSQGLKQLSLKGSIENLIASWEGTSSKILNFAEEIPTSQVAKSLQLKKKDSVFTIELIRMIPKGVFGHVFIYLPAKFGGQITRDELTTKIEMITFLENKLNFFVFRASQTIDVALATEDTARNLQIKTKEPVLFVERLYFSRIGERLFLTHNYFQPDLYKYRIELTRT